MDDDAISIGGDVWRITTLKKEELERLEDLFAQSGMESPLPKPTTPVAIDILQEVNQKNIAKISLDGAQLYKSGNFRWAYEKFKEVVQLAPTSQREVLNYAIIIARVLGHEGLDMILIQEGRRSIAFVGSIDPQNLQYKKLLIEWEKLEANFGTAKIPNL